MGNSLSDCKQLGFGNDKNVLLGKGKKTKNKDIIDIYLLKNDGIIGELYCKIKDSNFYKDKEYAISIFKRKDVYVDEIKKELQHYQNYQKYAPQLYKIEVN